VLGEQRPPEVVERGDAVTRVAGRREVRYIVTREKGENTALHVDRQSWEMSVLHLL
jgi:hypothetical protein